MEEQELRRIAKLLHYKKQRIDENQLKSQINMMNTTESREYALETKIYAMLFEEMNMKSEKKIHELEQQLASAKQEKTNLEQEFEQYKWGS